MKNLTKSLILVLTVAVVLVGCKQPTAQIDAAKAAIDDVLKGGADKYAPEELKTVQADLSKAMDEIAGQDKKFFKKFGTAKEMLVKVKADAESLKAALPAKIEAVKNEAVKLQGELQTAINEVKEMLKKAPKGKGTDKDLAALKGDLDGAETEFAGIQKALDGQDYIGALNMAKSIQAKVTGVKDQIQAALDKTKKK
jgi:DNA repair exonuclease SbcCD ATPase subunit